MQLEAIKRENVKEDIKNEQAGSGIICHTLLMFCCHLEPLVHKCSVQRRLMRWNYSKINV